MSHFPYKRAIVLLLDGACHDILSEEISRGHLPHLTRSFVEAGTFQKILTCFPSTTGPAYLPYLTGEFPGPCNIPGIRWFDKPAYAKHGWGFKSFRSYVGWESNHFNRDLNPAIKTVWEIFSEPRSILNIITKGLAKKNDLTRWQKSYQFLYGHLTQNWQKLDHFVFDCLKQEIQKKKFDFIFAVIPSVDEYAHLTAPDDPKVRLAYQNFDQNLGSLLKELKKVGLHEETLLLIVSDHGQSEVKAHFDVGPWLQNKKKWRTLFYTNIFKFRFDAVSMVSGNAMANLYFKNAKGWQTRTCFEELSHQSLLLDELRFREEIDFVATQGADQKIHILTERGHGAFAVDTQKNKIYYDFDRDDPLGLFLPTDERLQQNGFSFDESLNLTFEKNNPDIFVQLHQIFQSKRTGDVILSAKPGFDLRKKFEHPIHKSGHGALHRAHMQVPFLCNHKISEKLSRSVDVYQKMLTLLGM